MGVQIADYLSRGKENARSTKELCAELGLTVKQLRSAVSRARRAGELILTDFKRGGYFLAATREEVENFERSQAKRARCSFFTSKPAREALRQFEGQESLPL